MFAEAEAVLEHLGGDLDEGEDGHVDDDAGEAEQPEGAVERADVAELELLLLRHYHLLLVAIVRSIDLISSLIQINYIIFKSFY